MDELELLVTCSICLKWFDKPRLLPCQHTFCLEPCLRELYSNKRIRCPLCREDHMVIDGVANLPANLTVLNLMDVTSLQERHVICPECTQRLPSSSTMPCDHCSRPLCTSCRNQHRLSIVANILDKGRVFDSYITKVQEATAAISERKSAMLQQVDDIDKLIDAQTDKMALLVNRRKQALKERLCSFQRTESRKAHSILQDFGNLEESVTKLLPDLSTNIIYDTNVDKLMIIKSKIEGIEKDMELLDLNDVSNSSSVVSINFIYDDSIVEMISSFGVFNQSCVVGEKNCEESLSWNVPDQEESDVESEEIVDEVVDDPATLPEENRSPQRESLRVAFSLDDKDLSPCRRRMRSISMTEQRSLSPMGKNLSYAMKRKTFAYSSNLLNRRSYEHLVSVVYSSKGTPVMMYGNKGGAPGFFNWPRGVAFDNDSGLVAVADCSNHRCQILSLYGEHLYSLEKVFGDQVLDSPTGVAIDSLGQVIISDRYNHKIYIFDRSGRFVKSIGEEGSREGQFNCPWGLACDNMGFIHVADMNNNRIQVMTQNGDVVRSWGSCSTKDDLDHPQYLSLSSDNRKVYVSDSNNHRIMVYDTRGNVLQRIGGLGSHRGKLKYPRGIIVDCRGNVVVADSGNSRIQAFNPDGSFLCCFGSYGSGPGQFRGLEGVTLSPEGHVIIADRDNHRIQIF